ncbi:uncharacterized protein I303_105136 [Kwoniella dejecticola CBS 10117]|uniref:Uncharacterized protein n=1 Tax=Kwoniella dejecticola CBS 10117 TaxID=1296121 RepID=A0A1A6A3C6_9TREE|nr:uncharacterized protein I303_05419 [Kwoniella dejecticola CBS 10117]OBR84560.1 hypothetical protein I303_05419 [Kwoniella dejecticola CBS 10117]
MPKLSSTLTYKLLRRWDHLLRTFSTPLIPRWEVWSDASGTGYGGHLGPQSKPLDVWQDTHHYLSGGKGSTELIEAKALLLSLRKWCNELKGKKVWCYIDNYQVYQTLSHRYKYASIFHLSIHNKRRGLFFTSNPLQNPLQHLSPYSAFLSSPIPFIVASTSTTTTTTTSNLKYTHQTKFEEDAQSDTVTNPSTNSCTGTNTTTGRTNRPFTKSPQVKKIFDEIDDLINEYGITIKARWVWGKDNFLADKLSRLGNGNGRGTLTPHVLELLNVAASTSTTPTPGLNTGIGTSANTKKVSPDETRVP